MFRISFFVRDNRLADLLKSVDGKCLNLEVQPVKLADEAGKMLAEVQQEATSTSKERPLRTDLIKHAPKIERARGVKPETRVADAVWHMLPDEFSVADAKREAMEAGLSNSSITNRVNRGIKDGTLQRVGTGRYRKVAA